MVHGARLESVWVQARRGSNPLPSAMDYKQFLRAGKGASDITPLLSNGVAFLNLIKDLARLFNNVTVDKVAGVEGRGFILGSPVAYEIKVGLIPIRTAGKLKNEVYSEKYIDYSGKEKYLEIHQDAIKPGEKILLIDDWLETGATVKAAIKLIEKCEGIVSGIGVFMDDSSETLREELKKYNYQYIAKVNYNDKF